MNGMRSLSDGGQASRRMRMQSYAHTGGEKLIQLKTGLFFYFFFLNNHKKMIVVVITAVLSDFICTNY